jgi:hypothetical protein
MAADESGLDSAEPIERLEQRLTLPISAERLRSFRRPGDTTLDVLVNYFWNIELCEALYPCLNAVEIALRNSIHAGMTAIHDSERWLDDTSLFEPRQIEQILMATRDLAARGHAPTAGRLVAQPSFGFWVTLLSKPYEARIWNRERFGLLTTVFPHTARSERTRWNIYRRFADIGLLRNRVFHHEPVWNGMYVVTTRKHHPLVSLHADALGAIGWVSPELRASIELFDRFPVILASGRDRIAATLLSYLDRG